MPRGSHATWGAYDARVCFVCGRPVTLTSGAVWVHHDHTTGEHRTVHVPCGSPLTRRNTMTEPETEPTTEEPDTSTDTDDGGEDGGDEEGDGDTDAG